jgi:prolyl oligopeptidase
MKGNFMTRKFDYPESKIETVKEILHGYENIDDYRWLEGDEEGNMTEEVAEWTEKQNAFTRNLMDNLPGRSSLEKRIKPLLEIGSVSLPEIAGKKLFYFRREGSQNQPVNYYRENKDAKEQVLIDPNEIDPSGLTAIAWVSPDHDGNLVAFGEYKSGDENYTLKIIETESKKQFSDVIPGKVGGVFWLPDSSGFVYSRLADINNPYSRQICFHRLGDDWHLDPIIYEQHKTGPLAATWGPFASLSEDGKWLILGYHTSTRSNDLWLVDFSEWQKTGKLKTTTIAEGLSSTFHAEVNNGRLYIFTNYNAPNGKLLAVSLANPSFKNAIEILPEKENAVLEAWNFTSRKLLAKYQKNAMSSIQVFDKEGTFHKEIKLPGPGSAGFSCCSKNEECFVGFTSFTFPNTVFALNPQTGDLSKWLELKINVDLSDVETTQKWFESYDKTKVSMFLVHKKGLKLDGNNPTLIYGYGGFTISMTPGFSPLLCPWLEDGGVYAMVNLRGGNEYGDKWHRDGMRDKKTNVFADLEGAAEYLVNQKITSTEKLAVMGRSNGGLLAGAALTRRPDLYKAIICGVPLLDMLRYHRFLMARFWVPEYGNPEDPEEFKWLIEYSPYQKVKKGVNYPATFIHSGENDTRVHPSHARKMTAILQNCSAEADTAPILLWIDRDSGHGQGKPVSIRLMEETDQWLFLRWQLGMNK